MRPRCHRAVSLAELVVAIAILAVVAALALTAWTRSQEASALHQGAMQTAAILRDAMLRTQGSDPAAAGGLAAQVVFTPTSGTVIEQIETNGTWQTVAPAGVGLVLPAGVTVQRTTWARDTMQVQAGDTTTGTYEAYHITAVGSVTLATAHGMTTVVNVTGAGTVWY